MTNAIAQARVLLRAMVTVEVHLARSGAEEIKHVLSKKRLDEGEVRFSLQGDEHAFTVSAQAFDDDFYVTVIDDALGSPPPGDPLAKLAREARDLVDRVLGGQERMPLRFELTQTGKTDAQGRRHFTLAWVDPDGRWEPRPHNVDRRPVGYRNERQCHAVPETFIKRLQDHGHVVQVFEDVSEEPVRARKAGRR